MALIVSRDLREAQVHKEIETEEDQRFTCLFVCLLILKSLLKNNFQAFVTNYLDHLSGLKEK
jgi:hypothetical protein